MEIRSGCWGGYAANPVQTERFVATLAPADAEAAAALPDTGKASNNCATLLRLTQGNPTLSAKWITLDSGVPRLKARNQGSAGSCVGNGCASAATGTLAQDIAGRGEAEQLLHWLSADASYGLGKLTSNRLNGDTGTYVSAVAKGYMMRGMPFEMKYGSVDLTDYSVATAKLYARSALPDVVLQGMASHKIKRMVRVDSQEQLIKLLQHGYCVSAAPVRDVSGKRDANGIARMSGIIAHCEAWMDVWFDAKSNPYILQWNSWGSSWPGGPLQDWMPLGSVLMPIAECQKTIDGGDCFAFAGPDGFTAKNDPTLGV